MHGWWKLKGKYFWGDQETAPQIIMESKNKNVMKRVRESVILV